MTTPSTSTTTGTGPSTGEGTEATGAGAATSTSATPPTGATAGTATAGTATTGEGTSTSTGQGTEQSTGSEHGTGEGTADGSEAARYRRRLRETETDRDAQRGRVEQLQRADVERIAGEDLAQGADLFTLGVTLADVVDDQGDVDPERVRTAARGLVADRPGLGHPGRTGPHGPTNGMGQGRRGTTGGGGRSWADVVNPQRAR